jgi:hypothetical protein
MRLQGNGLIRPRIPGLTGVISPTAGARPGFPRTGLEVTKAEAFALRKLSEDALPIAVAGNLAPIMKTTRHTCIRSERRSGSSSAIGHVRIPAARSSDMPRRCSIFSAGDQYCSRAGDPRRAACMGKR